MNRFRDSLRRAFRGLLQLIAGGGLATLFEEATGGWDGSAKAAAVVGFTFLVTWAQNELEDIGAIPAVLKAPASDGADPIPEP